MFSNSKKKNRAHTPLNEWRVKRSVAEEPTSVPSYTLIETLLALAIAVIITISATQYLTHLVAGKQFQIALQELDYNASFASNTITRVLREAKDIDTINSILSTHPGKITLQMPGTFDPTIIQSSGEDLTLQQLGNPPQSLITNAFKITQFVLTAKSLNNAPYLISGTMTLQHQNLSNINKTFTFTVAKRSTSP